MCLSANLKIRIYNHNLHYVFNPHKSFPGGQLNDASRKSLEIQASCIAKKKNPFEPKICLYEGFKML